MLLVNEKLPNCKFAHGKEIIETDASGHIELKDKEAVVAFLASGFTEVQRKASATKVDAVKVEPVVKEEIFEEAVIEAPRSEDKRARWSRSEK